MKIIMVAQDMLGRLFNWNLSAWWQHLFENKRKAKRIWDILQWNNYSQNKYLKEWKKKIRKKGAEEWKEKNKAVKNYITDSKKLIQNRLLEFIPMTLKG